MTVRDCCAPGALYRDGAIQGESHLGKVEELCEKHLGQCRLAEGAAHVAVGGAGAEHLSPTEFSDR